MFKLYELESEICRGMSHKGRVAVGVDASAGQGGGHQGAKGGLLGSSPVAIRKDVLPALYEA